MKDMNPQITELLVLRATEGLSDAQARALKTLLNEHNLEDTTELDLAAAAASNAFALTEPAQQEQAPDYLKDKLRQDADQFFKDHRVIEFKPKHAPRESRGVNWGWATAAMLVVAMFVSNVVDFSNETTLEAQRNELIARASTTVVDWGKPNNPAYADVTGNVVWNDDLQQGYLLLSNMPVNDPATTQYQLWVVDADRDANPVDGGVFDIPEGETTVIIPINAKLAVSGPEAFAITREKPGGVVVSKGPLLVVAAV